MLSIGSLLFIIVLMIVYFLKIKRYSSSKNGFFPFMLIVTALMLLLENINFIGLYKKDTVEEIIKYSVQIETILKYIWFISIDFYFLTFGAVYDTSTVKGIFKNNKKILLLNLFTLISIVIYIILPIKFNVMDNSYYQEGLGFIWYVIYLLMILFISIIIVGKNKNKLVSQKITIILVIIFILSNSAFLQLVFPHIYIVTTGFTVVLYILYFAFENPDLFLIKELETTKKEIERSNSAKTDFLSNTTHDVRAPMNAIMGFTVDLLDNDDFNIEEAKKDVKNINDAANNLLGIVNNILDISKIESGNQTINEVDYNINTLVDDIKKMIEPRLQEEVKFIAEISGDVPQTLKGDRDKIYQILLNIISNAIKNTEIGRIKLKIKDVKMEEKVLLDISISDTGIGIKEEDYDKVFEKFSKIDGDLSDVEGTGLGLVISKKLINLLGGSITFKSHYLAGTTFYIKLEQKISTKVIEEEHNKLENTNSYLDCSSHKVLIVDDNKLNIKVAEKLLKPYNFTIKSVNNGEDCIKEVKKDEFYDMIFLDHMMPQMDGIEVLHILKGLDGYKLPPIVALTANAIAGMKEMYLNEGFDEYLSKPINTKELDKLINKYFSKEEK